MVFKDLAVSLQRLGVIIGPAERLLDFPKFLNADWGPGRTALSAAVARNLLRKCMSHSRHSVSAAYAGPIQSRLQEPVHVERRRFYRRLAQHHMNLRPMMSLMIEKVRDGEERRIAASDTFAVDVLQL